MATLQHRAAAQDSTRAAAQDFTRAAEQASKPGSLTVAPADRRAVDVSATAVAVVLLGVAALAAAAASSLLTLPGGGAAGGGGLGTGVGDVVAGPGSALAWPAGAVSAAYCLAALLYALAAFRRGVLPHPAAVLRVVGVAAGVHLAVLLEGLWRMPESGRTLDVTLASLLTLELAVIAAVGWRSNAALRRDPSPGSATGHSAAAVLGVLFAASLLVAGVTTLGMAASAAGDLAVPHSGHGGTHQVPAVPQQLQQLKEQGHHH